MFYTFAPMEGITNSIFRRTHARYFPGTDRYAAPFLAPDGQGRIKSAALLDLDPERNSGIPLLPQILCNSAGAFLALSRELEAMGFTEVNLNAGCPSGTVVPKHKGAGMLLDLRSLDAFLNEVFAHSRLRVSVKSRLGLESTAEFPTILEIYNRYPLSELILHARDRKGLYQSRPDLKAFAAAFSSSRAPLCYNGNILSPAHRDRVLAAVPDLERLMPGRGADPTAPGRSASGSAGTLRLSGGALRREPRRRDRGVSQLGPDEGDLVLLRPSFPRGPAGAEAAQQGPQRRRLPRRRGRAFRLRALRSPGPLPRRAAGMNKLEKPLLPRQEGFFVRIRSCTSRRISAPSPGTAGCAAP